MSLLNHLGSGELAQGDEEDRKEGRKEVCVWRGAVHREVKQESDRLASLAQHLGALAHSVLC